MESMKLRCRSEVEFIAHFLSPSPNLFQIAEKKNPYDSLFWCLKSPCIFSFQFQIIKMFMIQNIFQRENTSTRWWHFRYCGFISLNAFWLFFVTQHTKVKMMVIGWNCIGGTALCASNKTHLCSTIITGEAAHTTRKILQVHHQEIKYRNSNLSKCEMNEAHYILYFCKRAL